MGNTSVCTEGKLRRSGLGDELAELDDRTHVLDVLCGHRLGVLDGGHAPPHSPFVGSPTISHRSDTPRNNSSTLLMLFVFIYLEVWGEEA